MITVRRFCLFSLGSVHRGSVRISPAGPTLMFSVFFQMNASFKGMITSSENDSIVHLPAPIFPEMLGSNVTIIQTGNTSIIENQIFLNTVAAQVLSGIFVWSALLITCHQVSQFFFFFFFFLNTHA